MGDQKCERCERQRDCRGEPRRSDLGKNGNLFGRCFKRQLWDWRANRVHPFGVRRVLRLAICELHRSLAIGIGVDASSRIVGLDPEHELEQVCCCVILSAVETFRRIGTAVRVK